MIGFNKPYISGNEFQYMQEAIQRERLSGNGFFTKKCQAFFEQRYGFKKTLLTHSCTAALEMAAILLDVSPGDEIIIPSYTFVSTANPFVLRGATIVFADSRAQNPNIDAAQLAGLVTAKTKAIVVVHYAGVACDMDSIMELAAKKNLFVVEDAAQAIDSYYGSKALGSIGHLGAMSFHETKNVISGEGGLLIINDERFMERAEIIWEKGTNRSAFSAGKVDKYTWVDIGSSFLPSEITAAFLYGQLENIDQIQGRRLARWRYYHDQLELLQLPGVTLPYVDDFATNRAHIFYIVVNDSIEKEALLLSLHHAGIQAIFHYLPLHKSPFIKQSNPNELDLPNADRYGSRLIRLPLFVELTEAQVDYVVNAVSFFYKSYNPISNKTIRTSPNAL